MNEKLEYVVLADGRVAGELKAKGNVVLLTEQQAQYENVVRNTSEAIEAHAKAHAIAKVKAEADAKAIAAAEKEATQTVPETIDHKSTEAKDAAALEALEAADAKFQNADPTVIGVDLANGPDETVVAPAPTAKRGRAKK